MSFAISSNTGIVLRALIIPPIPRVSAIVCFKPYWLGISKSITVEGLYPPTCIVVCTKFAPTNDSFLSVCEVIFGDAFNFFDITFNNSCEAFNLTGSISCKAISMFLNFSTDNKSVTIFLVNTALPAPMIVNLIIFIIHDCVRRRYF